LKKWSWSWPDRSWSWKNRWSWSCNLVILLRHRSRCNLMYLQSATLQSPVMQHWLPQECIVVQFNSAVHYFMYSEGSLCN